MLRLTLAAASGLLCAMPAAQAAEPASPLWAWGMFSPNHDSYTPCMLGKKPNANGQYEVWCQSSHNKDYYAAVEADKKKALCNASASDACVAGDPNWHEYLISVIFVK